MHVITRRPLVAFSELHRDSKTALDAWYEAARRAQWENILDTRRFFPHADLAEVRSGNMVTIFNICGNKYRLVTAIHYDRQRLFVLRVMTHREYSQDRWKETL